MTKVIGITNEMYEEIKDITVEEMIQKFTGDDEEDNEAVNDAVPTEEDEKDEDDDLLDLLTKALLRNDKNLYTILELKFYGDENGLRIEAGGSTIAGKAFCDLGPGFEQLYEDIKARFNETAAWINERMGELGVEGYREV